MLRPSLSQTLADVLATGTGGHVSQKRSWGHSWLTDGWALEGGGVVSAPSRPVRLAAGATRKHATGFVECDDEDEECLQQQSEDASNAHHSGRPTIDELKEKLQAAAAGGETLDPTPGMKTLVHETSLPQLGQDIRNLQQKAIALRSAVKTYLARDRLATLSIQDAPDYLQPVAQGLVDVAKAGKEARQRLANVAEAASELQEHAEGSAEAEMEQAMAKLGTAKAEKRAAAGRDFQEAVEIYKTRLEEADAQAKVHDPGSQAALRIAKVKAQMETPEGEEAYFAQQPDLRDVAQITPSLAEAKAMTISGAEPEGESCNTPSPPLDGDAANKEAAAEQALEPTHAAAPLALAPTDLPKRIPRRTERRRRREDYVQVQCQLACFL
eukprot:TRINITY_DN123196_c0_g1_i1.p1 TRINITY_DN123196_c0_g1~~TRINITY_DN123196_c0_g1_i1.p1  ORF type:complete len:383 (-),score=122.17 TRINITY_DN123196_c0_g1_i1:38-1186(-)